MTFYMVRNKKTGKWFKRGSPNFSWVSQEVASAWTNLNGPRACKGTITRYNRGRVKSGREPIEIEILEFNVNDSDIDYEDARRAGYDEGYYIGFEAGKEEGLEQIISFQGE